MSNGSKRPRSGGSTDLPPSKRQEPSRSQASASMMSGSTAAGVWLLGQSARACAHYLPRYDLTAFSTQHDRRSELTQLPATPHNCQTVSITGQRKNA